MRIIWSGYREVGVELDIVSIYMIENAMTLGYNIIIGAIYMENRSGPRTEHCGIS